MSEQKLEAQPESKQESKTLPAVQANDRGVLVAHNLDSRRRLAQYLFTSRMLPKQYDTAEKVGAGIEYAVQLGFGDRYLLAMRQIAVINGTPSLFGDLPLALVRSSGLLEEFEEYLIDKDFKMISVENRNLSSPFVAAICVVKRKGMVRVEKHFTVEDAKTAGVWGKNVWAPYPKRMIQMRVRSIALKDQFADILAGMSIGEYDHNTTLERVVEVQVEGAPSEGIAAITRLMPKAAETEPQWEEPASEAPAKDQSEPAEVVNQPVEAPTGSFAAFNESSVLLAGGEQ